LESLSVIGLESPSKNEPESLFNDQLATSSDSTIKSLEEPKSNAEPKDNGEPENNRLRKNISEPKDNGERKNISEPKSREKPLTGYHIFTDGSYNGEVASSAFVLVKDGVKIFESFGIVEDSRHSSSYQIMGEFSAVIMGLQKCTEMGVKSATIHYDLALIGGIATGKYQAKAEVSRYFRNELAKFNSLNLDIAWNKVKAHSGVKWNELADKLANLAFKKNEELSLEEFLRKDFGG